jgi:hypothetical protein
MMAPTAHARTWFSQFCRDRALYLLIVLWKQGSARPDNSHLGYVRFVFSVLVPWWPSQENRSDWNLVCEVIRPRGTYVQSFMSIAPVYKMACANGQRPVWPCILIRCTYDKNLEMIQPLIKDRVIALFVFGPLMAMARIDWTEICSQVIWLTGKFMPIPAGPMSHAHFASTPADGIHYDLASDDTVE